MFFNYTTQTLWQCRTNIISQLRLYWYANPNIRISGRWIITAPTNSTLSRTCLPGSLCMKTLGGHSPRTRLSSQRFLSSDAGGIHSNGHGEFHVFYGFQYIVPMRVLSRLKIYQTATMALFLPILKYLEINGDVSSEFFWPFTGIASFSLVMLFVMSHFFRRLVGLMSVNETGDTVKVSHLTFWGNRKDIYIPRDEIVPIADLNDEPNDIYIKLRRYDSEEYLYYTIRYGSIRDFDTFKRVFGASWRK